MIDLRLLRDDPDRVRASQRHRGADPGAVDALLAADEARRAAVTAADNLRAESNTASKGIQSAADEERPALIVRAKELKDAVRDAEAQQVAADEALRLAHLAIANVVETGVPAGGEDDYVVLEELGTPTVGATRRTTSSSARCSAPSTPSAERKFRDPVSSS